MDYAPFHDVWNEAMVVRLSREATADINLPETSRAFLADVGLPKRLNRMNHEWMQGGLRRLDEVEDFGAVRDGEFYLDSPLQLENDALSPEARLRRMRVLSKDVAHDPAYPENEAILDRMMRFYIGVEEGSGHVFRLCFGERRAADAEFINGSIEQYAGFLLPLWHLASPERYGRDPLPRAEDYADEFEYIYAKQDWHGRVMDIIKQEWAMIDPVAVSLMGRDEYPFWLVTLVDTRTLF